MAMGMVLALGLAVGRADAATTPGSAEPAPAAPTTVAAPATAPAPTPAEPAPSPAPPAPSVGTIVFPVRSLNLTLDDVIAADAALRAAVTTLWPAPIADDATVRRALTGTSDADLAAICGQLSCTRWLTADVVRIPEGVFVITRLHTPDGAVAREVQVRTDDVKDLPAVFDRAAQALDRGVPYEKTVVSHTLAPATTGAAAGSVATVPPRPRPKIERLYGIRFGGWVHFSSSTGPAFAAAYDVRREHDHDFYETDVGIAWPADDFLPFTALYAEWGYSRFFNVGKVELYGGGGLGPRIVVYPDDGGLGLGLYGQLGITTNRDPHWRAFAQVRLGIDVATSFDTGVGTGEYAALETGIGF